MNIVQGLSMKKKTLCQDCNWIPLAYIGIFQVHHLLYAISLVIVISAFSLFI